MENLKIAEEQYNNYIGPNVWKSDKYGELTCQIVPFPKFHYCNMRKCNNNELYISYRNNETDFDMCIDCYLKNINS